MSIAHAIGALGPEGLAARGTLLLLIGWGGALGLRHAAASARHFIWLSVIVGVLMLPALAHVGTVRVAILPSAASLTDSVRGTSPATAVVSRLGLAPSDMTTPVVGPPGQQPEIGPPGLHNPAQRPASSGWSLGLGLWLTVAGILIVWLVAGLVSIDRILRRSRAIDSARWQRALADACTRMHLVSVPRLLVSDQVEVAFTCNALRPTIVLPRSADEWSDECLRAVLLHEVAHIRRRDLIGHTVAGIACAVYWFNPLIWLAARRLRVESELACDDLVLNGGLRGSDYAEHLLGLVSTLARRQSAPARSLAMVRSKDFEERLIAILDGANRRRTMGRAQFGSLMSVLGLLTICIAAGSPVPRGATLRPNGRSAVPPASVQALSYAGGGRRRTGDSSARSAHLIPYHGEDSMPAALRRTRLPVRTVPAQCCVIAALGAVAAGGSTASAQGAATRLVHVVVQGCVVDGVGSLAARGATVHFAQTSVTASTDSTGFFVLEGGVPPGDDTLMLTRQGAAPRPTLVAIGDVARLIVLPPVAIDSAATAPTDRGNTLAAACVARTGAPTSAFVDLRPPTVIQGCVRGPNGRGIPGTVVRVSGTARSAKTDTSGYFVVPKVPAGSLKVDADRIGFAHGQWEGALDGTRDTLNLGFALQEVTLSLSPPGTVIAASTTHSAPSGGAFSPMIQGGECQW